MGLDLRLLPFDADRDDLHFSHTILGCARDYDLFDAVHDVASERGLVVPSDFWTFLGMRGGEHGYAVTTETPYGDPLRYVLAGDLKPLTALAHRCNEAVWAYINALPDETKVALYWC